jgi:hypothetical protein
MAAHRRAVTVIARLACGWTLFLGGCHRDPNLAYARLLERAASWAASVQFTGEMARARYVPRTYVHDVLSTAGTELESLGQQFLNDDQIDVAARTQAAEWCRGLGAIVQAADRARDLPDERDLREIELRLREAARVARGAAPPEPRR